MNSGYAEKMVAGFVDGSALSVEESVASALGDWAVGYHVDRIVEDYRSAINDALRPYGLHLVGDLLIGRADTDYSEFNLDDILDEVGFWSIAERHEKTGK